MLTLELPASIWLGFYIFLHVNTSMQRESAKKTLYFKESGANRGEHLNAVLHDYKTTLNVGTRLIFVNLCRYLFGS